MKLPSPKQRARQRPRQQPKSQLQKPKQRQRPGAGPGFQTKRRSTMASGIRATAPDLGLWCPKLSLNQARSKKTLQEFQEFQELLPQKTQQRVRSPCEPHLQGALHPRPRMEKNSLNTWRLSTWSMHLPNAGVRRCSGNCGSMSRKLLALAVAKVRWKSCACNSSRHMRGDCPGNGRHFEPMRQIARSPGVQEFWH